MEDLLAYVKLSLRINHTFLDNEILELIEQCKDDFKAKGVQFNETVPKHRAACKLYCQRSLLDESFEKIDIAYSQVIKEIMLNTGDTDEQE